MSANPSIQYQTSQGAPNVDPAMQAWIKETRASFLDWITEGARNEFESKLNRSAYEHNFLNDPTGAVVYNPEANEVQWVGSEDKWPCPMAFNVFKFSMTSPEDVPAFENACYFLDGGDVRLRDALDLDAVESWIDTARFKHPEILEGRLAEIVSEGYFADVGFDSAQNLLFEALQEGGRGPKLEDRVGWFDKYVAAHMNCSSTMEAVVYILSEVEEGESKSCFMDIIRAVGACTDFAVVGKDGESVVNYARRVLEDAEPFLGLVVSIAEQQALTRVANAPEISTDQQKSRGRL
jgi:hypothetical protein